MNILLIITSIEYIHLFLERFHVRGILKLYSVPKECQSSIREPYMIRLWFFLHIFLRLPSDYIPRRASLDLTRITLHFHVRASWSKTRLVGADKPAWRFPNWNTMLFQFDAEAFLESGKFIRLVKMKHGASECLRYIKCNHISSIVKCSNYT